jgi:hypothetical protein
MWSAHWMNDFDDYRQGCCIGMNLGGCLDSAQRKMRLCGIDGLFGIDSQQKFTFGSAHFLVYCV